MRRRIDQPTRDFDAQPIWAKLGYPSREAYHADPRNQQSFARREVVPAPVMSAPASHGEAIVCERIGNHTYAYEDARIAVQVPAGYFVEWWPRETIAHAGHRDSGYARGSGPGRDRMRWFDWYSALCWCRHEARWGKRAA